MRLTAAVALFLAVAPLVQAANAEYPSISSVLSRATAIEEIGDRLFLIATGDGGYVCSIEVNRSYLRQLVVGIKPSESVIPEAFCFAATRIVNEAEKTR